MAPTSLQSAILRPHSNRVRIDKGRFKLDDPTSRAVHLAIMQTLRRANAAMGPERKPEPGDARREAESQNQHNEFHRPSSRQEKDGRSKVVFFCRRSL
ncbi:hypothetical protein JIX58_08525 [Brevundimonas diminuta]|uniref:hypothetical protein n=1 Tax=Brevundimonas diminuta TaxID=293 RepID=UPI0019038488|nr:hypothetical protein [Brevundimonas diminuta]MBK1975784.1 hypothetical protein [Brevundimonas diminuta]